jgi:hypothetical protein
MLAIAHHEEHLLWLALLLGGGWAWALAARAR